MSGLAVQRWRMLLRRTGVARSAPRDASAALEQALPASGLPIAMTSTARPRPRITFGPPVPVGMTASEEIVDVVLGERLARHVVRERLEGVLPNGHELMDLHDVWVGAPSLVASVIAADYRVVLHQAVGRRVMESALETLLAAATIDRSRDRDGTATTYDLRPFIEDLRLTRSDTTLVVDMRLAIDQQRGVGRPEEVLAELRERTGLALEPIEPIERRRLHLSPG